jgi:hypothetical protein
MMSRLILNPQYIVVDLDGTLCDIGHRVDYAKAGQWDDFHSRCPKDMPHMDVLNLLNAAVTYNILACTGRNERYRNLTIDWIMHHGAPVEEILMRPDDDYRQDAVLKIGLLEDHFGSRDEVIKSVAFCLDDRDKVVEAYRNYGLPAWQVRLGEY